MTDYTMKIRLCDDDGMVSHAKIVDDMPTLDRSYLERLNRLRNMTRTLRGEKPEIVEEPFVCTGHAHLAGEHMQCTSPYHKPKGELLPDERT